MRERRSTPGSGGRPRTGERPGYGRPGQGGANRSARRYDDRPERTADIAPGPALPGDLDLGELPRDVRAELRSLSKPNADVVGSHLLAAALVVDSDPPLALAHARAARARAARLAVVREAVGVAAYRAGEWAEALAELRAARRISGDPRNLPLIADCERALGRATQAVNALSDKDVRRLDAETRVELVIVVAGARRDLGQLDAALATLERGGLDRKHPGPGAARLWYAYDDLLEAGGRIQDAAQWFVASAEVDVEDELDAAERAAALL